MSVWEFIGWLIAVPLALMTALFVYAVSVAVVRVTVKRRQNETSAKPHLKAVD
jgi:ABC-type phosphate transport system permease subunit